MDIGKFIDEYVATKDAGAKERLAKKHVTTTYLDYAKKIEEAKKIVKFSCYDGDGIFKINSPLRFMLFTISVVRSYTDLEFTQENFIGQFDLLMKHGVMDSIVSNIGQDYSAFETLLKMTLDDEYENNRAPVSYFEQRVATVMAALAAMDVPENETVEESVDE